MARDKLSGIDKAAILLMNIGEELASEVCKHLTPMEMQMLGSTIVKKESVSLQISRDVMADFMEDITGGEMIVEGLEFTKNILIKSLGPEKAKSIIEHITRQMQGVGIESLKWMDPAIVANIVKNEHPQIIALILLHLEPDKAAQVLLNIPDEARRGEIVVRIATFKMIPENAVRDLEQLLSEQMLQAGSGHGSSIEGVKIAAEILNQIDTKSEGGIMDTIEKVSPDLALKIQEKMFVFADLMGIDQRGIQLIIKELSTDILSVALKGSDEQLKDKFLKNMSERAAEMLKEDMDIRGPVRLSDVEKAQQEIIKVARRLESEGKIVRSSGKGGDVFV